MIQSKLGFSLSLSLALLVLALVSGLMWWQDRSSGSNTGSWTHFPRSHSKRKTPWVLMGPVPFLNPSLLLGDVIPGWASSWFTYSASSELRLGRVNLERKIKEQWPEMSKGVQVGWHCYHLSLLGCPIATHALSLRTLFSHYSYEDAFAYTHKMPLLSPPAKTTQGLSSHSIPLWEMCCPFC